MFVFCVLSCVVSDGVRDIPLTRDSERSAHVILSSVLVQGLIHGNRECKSPGGRCKSYSGGG